MSDLRTFGCHKLDLEELTVYFEDEDGELHDMNADGDPIDDLVELRSFVRMLGDEGAFGDMRENAMVRLLNRKISNMPPRTFDPEKHGSFESNKPSLP